MKVTKINLSTITLMILIPVGIYLGKIDWFLGILAEIYVAKFTVTLK